MTNFVRPGSFDKSKLVNNDKNNADTYNVYVFHRSYFCGKMLAYLRYKEIPHNAIYESLADIGSTLMQNTGLRQMPVVETPKGEWLQDTTPMMDWFEKQYTENPVLPDDPILAFCCRLLEDYADEWMWRPAIYYRWITKEDRYMYKSLFVEEFVGGFWKSNPLFSWIGGNLVHRHQNEKFLFGDGITDKNSEHVESVYLNTLDRLEALFQAQDYIFGDRPSLADFGFFGSMFWHFSNDPTPNRLMQERAPAVYEWVARMWNAKASKFEGKALSGNREETLNLLAPLLKDVCANYLPYLEQNALALDADVQRFDMNIEGYQYPGVHVSPYRVWCREKLQKHYSELSIEDQNQLSDLAKAFGSLDALKSHSQIQSNWDPDGIAPLCRPGKIPLKQKLLARFTGTNHVRSRRLWA